MIHETRRIADKTRAGLWRLFSEEGDQAARAQLIVAYRYLVVITARRHFVPISGLIERGDLEGTGMVGLIRAIDQFEPQRGLKFQTYAITLIRGAILEMLRGDSWVPRTQYEAQKKLAAAEKEWKQREGRSASDEEIAGELGVTLKVAARWRRQAGVSGKQPASLDAPINSQRGSSATTLGETLLDAASPVWQQIIEGDSSHRMLRAIAGLPSREAIVIRQYYGKRLTMKAIGPLLGISESRVYQLRQQAIKRLRDRLGEDFVLEG